MKKQRPAPKDHLGGRKQPMEGRTERAVEFTLDNKLTLFLFREFVRRGSLCLCCCPGDGIDRDQQVRCCLRYEFHGSAVD